MKNRTVCCNHEKISKEHLKHKQHLGEQIVPAIRINLKSDFGLLFHI